MAGIETLDLVFRLKFEAAIQDHVAKKATNRRAKIEAKKKAQDLRDQAQTLERAQTVDSSPDDAAASQAT